MSSIAGLPAPALQAVNMVLSRLRRRQMNDAYEAALYTLLMFQNVIGALDTLSAKLYLDLVSDLHRAMGQAHPSNFIPGNICIRLSHIIQEEGEPESIGDRPSSGLQDESLDLKFVLLEEIKGLVEEIKTQDLNFARQAMDQLHSNEVLLTIGFSRAVFQFLKAAKTRHPTVFVADNVPTHDGQKMVEQLQQLSIDATLITDAAIFAIMPRVHRVLLGPQSVAADGGSICAAGSFGCSVVAAQHQVPVCLCVGTYQIGKNVIPPDAATYSDPGAVWQREHADEDAESRTLNLVLEHVPASNVDLIITHGSSFSPAHVVRFLGEIGIAV